jgi:hypothetical protein
MILERRQRTRALHGPLLRLPVFTEITSTEEVHLGLSIVLYKKKNEETAREVTDGQISEEEKGND